MPAAAAPLSKTLRGDRRDHAIDTLAHAWAAYMQHTARAVREAGASRVSLDRSFAFGVLLRSAEGDGHDRVVARYVVGEWVTDALLVAAQRRARSLVRLLRSSDEFDLGPEHDPAG